MVVEDRIDKEKTRRKQEQEGIELKASIKVQLDHSNVAYVMDSVFINIQLTINNCLSKGFPDQINESFTRMYRYDLKYSIVSQNSSVGRAPDQLLKSTFSLIHCGFESHNVLIFLFTF